MPQEKLYTPGEAIGSFEVVRLLATGGMGTVYEAEPDPLEHDDLIVMDFNRVAIKVPRLDAFARTPDERRQLAERFEREYRTLLKLNHPGHPNLVDVYEFGWHGDVPFLVMEYIEGPTLEDFLAGQPSLQEVLGIFRKLCEAVVYLHDHGVCHRDLKPSNVLLRVGGPVLIDLGNSLPPIGRRLTAPGEMIGTPLYLSPEAGRDWLAPSDKPYLGTSADDVWALGVCLYESLTGTVPWRTPPDRREALLREIQAVAPSHPSTLNPRVPRTLGDVALRLLDRDVTHRPRDGREVMALLDAALQATPAAGNVPPRARPALAPSERIGRRPVTRWGRRHPFSRRAVVVAAGVAFVLGIAGEKALEVLSGGQDPGPQALSAPSGQAEKSQPSEPLPGQMRPPCRKPYVEDGGFCWIELHPVTPEGEPAPCPTGPQNREVKGKDGRVHCYGAVMAPTSPNTEVPAEGGH